LELIQSKNTLFEMLTKLWANQQPEPWKRDPDRHWEAQAQRCEEYLRIRFQERHNPLATITSLMFNPDTPVDVDEDTQLLREWPSVMVKTGKTLALLSTVVGEPALPVEESKKVGMWLFDRVPDEEIVELLESGSEVKMLESPASPASSALPGSPVSHPSPNEKPHTDGFVTEDLSIWGLNENETEGGDIAETPSGGRAVEKRKASTEHGGDTKRMKGASVYPLQSDWI
jgi:hypothetical protein